MSLKSLDTLSEGDDLSKRSAAVMTIDSKVPRRHPKHYGSDQLIFLIDGFLYRVPADALRAGSTYFEEMLGSSHIGDNEEGKSDDRPITLGGISSFEMDNFLEVLGAQFGEDLELTFAQWSAALHLATMWTFEVLRANIIRHIITHFESQDPFDFIDTALKCRVGNWLHPAYQRLCQRKEPLSWEEGEKLGLKTLTAICRIREGQAKGLCGWCPACKAGNTCERYGQTLLQWIEADKDLRVQF